MAKEVVLRGGDKFEKRLAAIVKRLGSKKSLRVGFLSDSTYPDGTPVAMVAFILDSGAPNAGIPPRPFFRNMIAQRSPEWSEMIWHLLRTTNYNATETLNLLGDQIEGQLRQSIQDTNSPPLKPATIARKGFDKPLIHTSVMWNSVKFEVVG